MVGEGNRNRPVPVPGSRRNPGCLAQISKTGLGLPAFGLGLVWETNADHCGVPSDLSDSKNELGEKENAPFDASPPNHCPPLTTRRLASEAQLAFSPVAHGKPAGTCSMTPSPQLPSPALARRLARGASPGACRVSDHTSPLPAQGLDTCAAASALSSRLVPPVHSDEDGDGLVARGTSDVEDTDDEDVIMGMMTQTSENAANQKLPCLDAGSRDERPLHFNEKHEKQCLDMRDSLPGFPVHFHLKGQCSPVASMSSIPLAAVTAAQKGGISAQDCTLRLPAYVDEVGGLNSTLKPGGRVVYAAVPPQPCQAQTADPCCKISQRFCMTAETEEKDKEGLMGNQQKRTARHLQSRANVKRQKVGEPAENRQTKAIPFKELTNLDLSLISKRDGRESMTRSKFSKGELSQKGALLESCTASSENGECPGNLSCEVYEGRNDATIYMVKPIVNERSDCARLAQMRVKFSRVQDGGMRTAQDQAAAQRVATGSPGRQRCERAEGPSIPPHACDSGLAAPGMQGAGRLARGQTNAWSFIHPSRMLVGCGARSPCHQVAGRDTTRCLDSCGDPKESATMASPLCRPNGVEAKEGRGKAGQQEQEQEPAAEQGSKPPRDTSSESLGIVAEFWRSAEEESHETGSALQANEDDDIVQDSEGEEEQSVRWLPLQEGLWKGGRGTELRSRERDSRAEAAVRLHGTGTGTTDPAAREDDVANLAWGQKLQKWENNLLGVSAEKEEGREMRCDSRAKQSVECSGDPSVPKGCQREGELEHGRRVATGAVDGPVACPICGVDLRHLAPSWRDRHSNQCLDSQDRGALGGPPLLLPILLQQGKEKEKEKEKGKGKGKGKGVQPPEHSRWPRETREGGEGVGRDRRGGTAQGSSHGDSGAEGQRLWGATEGGKLGEAEHAAGGGRGEESSPRASGAPGEGRRASAQSLEERGLAGAEGQAEGLQRGMQGWRKKAWLSEVGEEGAESGHSSGGEDGEDSSPQHGEGASHLEMGGGSRGGTKRGREDPADASGAEDAPLREHSEKGPPVAERKGDGEMVDAGKKMGMGMGGGEGPKANGEDQQDSKGKRLITDFFGLPGGARSCGSAGQGGGSAGAGWGRRGRGREKGRSGAQGATRGVGESAARSSDQLEGGSAKWRRRRGRRPRALTKGDPRDGAKVWEVIPGTPFRVVRTRCLPQPALSAPGLLRGPRGCQSGGGGGGLKQEAGGRPHLRLQLMVQWAGASRRQGPGEGGGRASKEGLDSGSHPGVGGCAWRDPQDGFRHLSTACSHWFLTHFHTDHYQGITRGFRYGTIYCSNITAKLLKLKIGVPEERVRVLPLRERVDIEGTGVTFLEANHCPGAVMILFEPPNGEAVLHTGDFRWSAAMEGELLELLSSVALHTLILDTTYCNAKYDFPHQEVVMEYIVDAIAAEAFNPRTLCLIGTYTVGKERLFLEVARALRQKVYVGAAKQRMLACMDLPEEDLRWMTANDAETPIHAVPMWSIASFKRMASIGRHYKGKYDTVVAFSPSGWNFDRGKRKAPGRRMRKGTLIRYEVPYSEHCSFTELKDFVHFVNPLTIIPSVHNGGSDAAEALVSLLYEDGGSQGKQDSKNSSSGGEEAREEAGGCKQMEAEAPWGAA